MKIQSCDLNEIISLLFPIYILVNYTISLMFKCWLFSYFFSCWAWRKPVSVSNNELFNSGVSVNCLINHLNTAVASFIKLFLGNYPASGKPCPWSKLFAINFPVDSWKGMTYYSKYPSNRVLHETLVNRLLHHTSSHVNTLSKGCKASYIL